MVAKLLIIFLTISINSVNSQTYCNLKLAKDKLSSIRGGDTIFNTGILNEAWQKNLKKPLYTSDFYHDLDYFYATEIHENNSIKHEKISVIINSNNTALTNPTFEIKPEGFTSNLEISTIEILYHCAESQNGVAEISMTIKSDLCEAFTVTWNKVCKPKRFTPTGQELIKNGVLQQSWKVFTPDAEENYILNGDLNSLPIHLSYSKEGQALVLKEPELIYDNNLMNAVVSGPLTKGGILSDNSQSYFSINFACVPLLHSISLIEIILTFANNDVVSLYLRKECSSVGNLIDSYSFFSTIFYVFVILLVMFSAGLCYYNYKRNRILIKEMLNKFIDRLSDKYHKRDKSDRERLNYYATSREASYDENDLVNIKIKSELNSNSINTKYDSI